MMLARNYRLQQLQQLSEQERYALLTGTSGNPIQGVLADAAADYVKGLGISSQQLAIISVAVGSIKGIRPTNNEVPNYTRGTLSVADEASFSNALKLIDSGVIPTGPLAKKWGTQFKNLEGELPGGQGASSPYLEYRVAPSAGQAGAGTNRIVVNSKTGEVYYTWTHYGSSGSPAFVKVR